MSVLGNRLYKAFADQEHCDIKLQLQDGTLLKAHKIVLALGSKWFEVRLGGNWDTEANVVKCDIHSGEVTRAMIEFLYTSEIVIAMDNAEEIFQVADYYNAEDLIRKSKEFFENNMTNNNILRILTISNRNGIDELKGKCLSFLDLNVEKILSSPAGDISFGEMPVELMLEIIKRDTMCVHEELLFQGLTNWVTQFEEGEIPNIWLQITPHLRFGRMSLDFFLNNVVNKAIIDDALSLKVMVHISTLEEALPSQYSKERCVTNQNDIKVHRFPHHSSECTWEVDETLDGDRISFTLSREMMLRGVLVFGKPQAYLIFGIRVYSDTGNSLRLCSKTEVKQKCQTEAGIPVILPTPHYLEKGLVYTVALKTTGGPTAYGKVGLSNASLAFGKDEILCVKFLDSGCGCTNVQNGQIQGLIFHRV